MEDRKKPGFQEYLFLVPLVFCLVAIFLLLDARAGLGRFFVAFTYLIGVVVGAKIFKNRFLVILIVSVATLVYCLLLRGYVEQGKTERIKSSPGSPEINSELCTEARLANLDKVRALLEKGADVNTRCGNNQTPLIEALDMVSYKNDEIIKVVKVLLDSGARLDVKDNYGGTPLAYAARLPEGHNPKDVVNLLLQHGAQEQG